MAYPKGRPRPAGAGRKKGTPNLKTQTLIEKCEKRGIDLFDAFLEIIADPDHPHRFNAIKEAAQYVYPKRKALEHSGRIDSRMVEEAERLLDLTDEELAKLAEKAIKQLK